MLYANWQHKGRGNVHDRLSLSTVIEPVINSADFYTETQRVEFITDTECKRDAQRMYDDYDAQNWLISTNWYTAYCWLSVHHLFSTVIHNGQAKLDSSVSALLSLVGPAHQLLLPLAALKCDVFWANKKRFEFEIYIITSLSSQHVFHIW